MLMLLGVAGITLGIGFVTPAPARSADPAASRPGMTNRRLRC